MKMSLVSFGSRSALFSAIACGLSVSAAQAASAPHAVYYDNGGVLADTHDDGLDAFRVGSSWAGSPGTPFTLTWGVVNEGTTLPTGNVAGESADPSSLIAFMDSSVGAGPGGPDLTLRPWFNIFDESYARWDELSGLSISHEPNDDGANMNPNAVFSPGVAGVRADMRIGGHLIDGEVGSNVLAYNYFPTIGDMVIDTGNPAFFSNSTNDFRGLRNTLMHEIGHGLGFNHLESNNSNQLMEPFINTSFYGPQIDDILAVQRNYGDPLEESGGNDTIGTATFAQTFSVDGTWAIGTDAGSTPGVTAAQSDFVSIDDNSDTDLFAFTMAVAGTLDALLTPQGPTYNEGAQGGTQSLLDTAALSNLALAILNNVGGVVASSDTGLAGVAEMISGLSLGAGDYFARVTGADDNVQLYSLGLNVVVPEPGTLLLTAGLSGLLLRRRRGRAA